MPSLRSGFWSWLRLTFAPNVRENGLLCLARFLCAAMPIFLVAGRALADGAATLTALLFLAQTAQSARGRLKSGLSPAPWLGETWVRMALLIWGWLALSSLANGAVDGFNAASFVRAVAWIRFPIFAAALAYWVADSRWWRCFCLASCAALAFVAGDAWFQYVTGNDIFGFPIIKARLTGPFGKNEQVGIFLTKLAFLPLAPLAAKALQPAWKADLKQGGIFSGQASHGRALAAIVAVSALAATILVSGERMALLLFFFGLGLMFLALPTLRRLVLVAGLAAALGIGAIMLARPAVMERHVGQTSKTVASFSQSPYGKAWLNGLAVARERPVFGIGPRNFRNACTCKGDRPCGEDEMPCFLHPHNIYIEWAAETGFPGLAGFLILLALWMGKLGATLRRSPRPYEALGAWVAVAVTLWPLSATGSFFSNWNEALFWTALGVALRGAVENGLGGAVMADGATMPQSPRRTAA